jgi:hypothetical protein
MEVIRSSATSVHIQTTRRYIPEDGNVRNYMNDVILIPGRCKNFNFLIALKQALEQKQDYSCGLVWV